MISFFCGFEITPSKCGRLHSVKGCYVRVLVNKKTKDKVYKLSEVVGTMSLLLLSKQLNEPAGSMLFWALVICLVPELIFFFARAVPGIVTAYQCNSARWCGGVVRDSIIKR